MPNKSGTTHHGKTASYFHLTPILKVEPEKRKEKSKRTALSVLIVALGCKVLAGLQYSTG